jgi:mannose/cellobiose epimerase-like protein (N-acyl-D-glucosamine 2-epimerase family)
MIAAQLKEWMTGTVLPFWATQGVDAATGAFQERFHPDATPDLAAPRRLRVQARQIYVFAHAACLGWSDDGAAVALRAFDRLMDRNWGAGAAEGFAQSLKPDGSVHDPRRDSYDHAFVALALAWLKRATGEARVTAALDRTLAFIDADLTDPSGALYEDDLRSQPRRQNPQMHWFEAVLALGSAERVAKGLALFQSRFFDRKTGMVGEYYDDRWSRASGDAGEAVEPGHLAEWSWLLRQAAPLLKQDLDADADALLAAALPHRAPATKLLWDEIGRDGTVRLNSSRSWPMTELAKACLAKAETGDAAARNQAEESLGLLNHHFLGKPFAAGWLDRVTETGEPLSLMVSGSTLYHIFVAITEADRVLGAPLVK